MRINILVISALILLQISFTGCSKSTSQNLNSKTEKINQEGKKELNKNIYDLNVKTMDGQEKSLSDYKGKVLLIVNVASKCGYTKQYEGLEEIYLKYKDRGFEILAFPSNDFGGQEPGTNEEIMTFCKTQYNVTFPLFDKISVLGDDKNSLYERLTVNSDPSGDVDWNFEKFIIDKYGNIAGRYKSKVKPESEEITKSLESLLN
ncbi:MAG TPA: glutathione peroxidase [Ignavibacteria bacterium]|nr:glutathione peroxidase [Ignavibacteria bacterium]